MPKKGRAKQSADDLGSSVKKMLHEGNVRRILLKTKKEDFTILEIPVTIAIILTIFLPFVAVIVIILVLLGLIRLEMTKNKT